jgi:flagellar hook-length control protein FliK
VQVTESESETSFSAALTQAGPGLSPTTGAETRDPLSGNALPRQGKGLPASAPASPSVDLVAELTDAASFADAALPAVQLAVEPVRYFPAAERSSAALVATVTPPATAGSADPAVGAGASIPALADPALTPRLSAGLLAPAAAAVTVAMDQTAEGASARPTPAVQAAGDPDAYAPGLASRLARETIDIAGPSRIEGGDTRERQAAIALAATRSAQDIEQRASTSAAPRAVDSRLPPGAALPAADLRPDLAAPAPRERGTETLATWQSGMPAARASRGGRSVAPEGFAGLSRRSGPGARNPGAELRGPGLPPGVFAETLTSEARTTATESVELKPAATQALSAPSAAAAQARVASPSPAAPPSTVFSIEPPVLDPAWQTAVNERVVWMAGRNVQSAELRLNPAELGPVQVQVTVDEKAVSLSITAAHPLTREALENAMPRLRDMLSEHGMDLSGATVDDHGNQAPAHDGAEQAEGIADEQYGGSPQADEAVAGAAPEADGHRSDGAIDLFA